MFKIETWVGPKFGGWFAGSGRYTEDAAIAIMDAHRRGDIRSGGSILLRRIVPA